MTSTLLAHMTVNALAWSTWAIACGWWYRRLGPDELSNDGPILRIRPFETGGYWYERRLRIKRWKDHLPETGGWRGGVSKRALPGRGPDQLILFEQECRRGERTHWATLAGAPFFALWNSFDWFLVSAGCGLLANAPCIAVLRYNRSRLAGLWQRAGRVVALEPTRRGQPTATAPTAGAPTRHHSLMRSIFEWVVR